jgi:hypothetical protein
MFCFNNSQVKVNWNEDHIYRFQVPPTFWSQYTYWTNYGVCHFQTQNPIQLANIVKDHTNLGVQK